MFSICTRYQILYNGNIIFRSWRRRFIPGCHSLGLVYRNFLSFLLDPSPANAQTLRPALVFKLLCGCFDLIWCDCWLPSLLVPSPTVQYSFPWRECWQGLLQVCSPFLASLPAFFLSIYLFLYPVLV